MGRPLLRNSIQPRPQGFSLKKWEGKAMGARLEGSMGRLSGIPSVIIANLAEREREILDRVGYRYQLLREYSFGCRLFNFDSRFEVSGHTTKVSSFCFSFAGAKMYRICLESRKIALV